jgi:transcriptional regulator with XRE-family HTH domain
MEDRPGLTWAAAAKRFGFSRRYLMMVASRKDSPLPKRLWSIIEAGQMPAFVNEIVLENLIDARYKVGMRRFARACGMSVERLQSLERGEATVDLEDFQRIQRVLIQFE